MPWQKHSPVAVRNNISKRWNTTENNAPKNQSSVDTAIRPPNISILNSSIADKAEYFHGVSNYAIVSIKAKVSGSSENGRLVSDRFRSVIPKLINDDLQGVHTSKQIIWGSMRYKCGFMIVVLIKPDHDFNF
ncbi:hypothetical protein TNCV_33811 [Trichonephila clavipes]|nr:hypothetical protein TNCV_33811 [Trichonephila clavipes]